jgi:hypothetical protein
MPHKSVVVRVEEPADGLLAVTIRCCGDPKTDSVLTIHELHRSEAEIDKDIADYQARVEKLHEAKARALAHIARITNSLGDCGCK